MASFDLYGLGSQSINWPSASIPEIRVLSRDYFTSSSLGVSVQLGMDGGWRPGYIEYRGSFSFNSDGSVGGTVTGFDFGTDDGYYVTYVEEVYLSIDSLLALGGSDDAARELERRLVSGDDVLSGSIDGGSVQARLMGGNDYVELFSGLLNDVNTNWGRDTIALYGGGGRVLAGNDEDVVNIFGGQWTVNGNAGRDVITNYSSFAGTVRGGVGDDVLVNANGGGYFYGDLGADTFRPYVVNQDGLDIDGIMFIQDFQVGLDALDLSAVGGYTTYQTSEGTGVASGAYGVIAFLEGVFVNSF